jgi:hypothetical protein
LFNSLIPVTIISSVYGDVSAFTDNLYNRNIWQFITAFIVLNLAMVLTVTMWNKVVKYWRLFVAWLLVKLRKIVGGLFGS